MARLGAALASLVALIALGGCGGDKTPVAHVGDATITRVQLARELNIDSSKLPVDKVGYSACIARMKQAGDRGLPLGTPGERCRYEHLKQLTSALATLIHTQWVRQEAEAEAVRVTDAERRQARRLFGGAKVDDDFVETVALDDKLRARVAHAAVGAAELDAAVAAVQALHGARRDVLLVSARSLTDAQAARKALEDGVGFDAVARRYGDGSRIAVQVAGDERDDATVRYHPGRVLRSAVFAAPAAVLVGPVDTDGRFYVFRAGITTKQQKDQTPADLRAQVEQDLATARRGAAYERVLARRWLRRTRCEKEYVVDGGQVMLGGGVAVYYSSAGCGNFVAFKTPPPG